MSTLTSSASAGCKRTSAPAALVLAAVLLLQTATGVLASPAPEHSSTARRQPTVVLASGWGLGRLWHKGETFLSDRRRMIQLATLGMCLGIYIMMRSGKWY